MYIKILCFLSYFVTFISSVLLFYIRLQATLTRNEESGHPSLVLDLSRNALSFPPFSIILAVHLSCIALWLDMLFSIPSLFRAFYYERILYFVKGSISIYWVVMRFLSLTMCCINIYWFVYVELIQHIWNKVNLITVNDLFNVFLQSIYR